MPRKKSATCSMPRAAFYIAVLCLLAAIYIAGRRRPKAAPRNTEAFDEEDEEKTTAPADPPVADATVTPAPVDEAVGAANISAPSQPPQPKPPPAPAAMDFFGQSLHFMDDIKAIKEDVAYIKERIRKSTPSYESFYGGRIY